MFRKTLKNFFRNKVPLQDAGHPTLLTRHTEKTLRAISVTATADDSKVNFVAPNPDYNAKIRNAIGEIVGTAEFGISPLNETVFLYGLDILPAHQRQGYALALLVWLANEHNLPITPVHETIPARNFWISAHKFKASNLVLLDQLRCGEMNEEKSRWAHLVPESEAERLIREYKESEGSKSVGLLLV